MIALYTASATASDAYDESIARARALASSGDHAAAARTLDAVQNDYPQDYAIALECGYQYFASGQWADAERVYRSSLSRAPASVDARTGLVLALVREARCDDAAREAMGLPDAAQAEALAACTPASAWVARGAFVTQVNRGNPVRDVGLGGRADLDWQLGHGGTLGATVRYLHIGTKASSGVSSFDQTDLYLRGGYWDEGRGVLFVAAVVGDGSGTLKTSAHAGLSAHYELGTHLTPWAGDVRVDASISLYDDVKIGRVAPSWDIPVAGPLHLVPGFGAQADGTSFYANGTLGAVLASSAWSAWAFGKFGDEKRPAYLASSVVYDVLEPVAWGAWVGARVSPWKDVALEASAAFDELRLTGATTSAGATASAAGAGASGLYSFSVGPVITF